MIISQVFTGTGMAWQRSCFIQRHNLVSRGERELRGERHGKGGRSLFTTTASSFCIRLSFAAVVASVTGATLMNPSLAAAQVHLEIHAGGVMSSTVAEDQLATSVLRARFGNGLDESVTAHFTPAP